MNNNMFDPSMFKNLENMMKGFGDITSKPIIDMKLIKRLIVFAGLGFFLFGFSIGILIGLLF